MNSFVSGCFVSVRVCVSALREHGPRERLIVTGHKTKHTECYPPARIVSLCMHKYNDKRSGLYTE